MISLIFRHNSLFVFSYFKTKSQKEWYKEFYSYDQDEAKSYWEKLTQGYELVIGDPSKPKDEQEPFEHVFKV